MVTWLSATARPAMLSVDIISSRNDHARSGLLDSCGIAHDHPPARETTPGALPSCVGIGATSMTSGHSGHSAAPPSTHDELIQLPSRFTATRPSGIQVFWTNSD